MLNKSKLNRIAIAVAMSVGMSTAAMAQETSSGITGSVMGPQGNPAAGTVVTITHVPSGSTKTVVVNSAGQFTAKGLRVGGPYNISVDSDKFQDTTVSELYLTLGESYVLNVPLQDEQAIESITVTASSMSTSVFGSTGPSANFNLADIENAPAINRDINDIIRADPRIYIDASFNDAVQCAGSSPRYNSLTLDGVRLNDNFGLNSNGYPTERMPFSFDAIDQVAVELAPFDVQYGGFTACNINAVTKSGTNEVHGSAFYDYTSDSYKGDKVEGDQQDNGSFTEKRYGVNVGFPLIKDTLFFFGSYEKLEGAQLFEYNALGSRVSEADAARVAQIAQDVYNYDVGGFPGSAPIEDEKLLVKLDWNINEDHRASFVYNWNDGFSLSQSDQSSSSLPFSNHYYERGAELTSMVLSVYSDWNSDFTTEFRLGKTDLDNRQISVDAASGFPEVSIRSSDGGTLYLGPDDSRQANDLNWDNITAKLAGTYYLDEHTITAGVEFERLNVFNLFMQHVIGEYRFNSIDDFEAGDVDRIYHNNSAGTNNPNDAAASFTNEMYTFYVQDDFNLTDDVTMMVGLRYDSYASDDRPTENTNFENRYGFKNTGNIDGISLLQPRVGFNWSVNDNMEVRGGVGLYSGGNPNVWISNAYSNDGVTNIDVREFNIPNFSGNVFDTPLSGAGRPLFDVPQALYDRIANTAIGDGDGGTNATDPSFDIPSEWKYALGTTYITDDEYVITADLLYSDKKNSPIIQDLAIADTGANFPDGRPVYGQTGSRRGGSDFLLTNVNGADASAFTASLGVSKDFDNGVDASLSYSYTDAKDVNPMTSSVAFSNYSNIAVSDPQNPGVATSDYQIQHRFTATLGYAVELFDGYDTKFNIFGAANEGKPYSYTYSNARIFGDVNNFRGLIYVPEVNDANVVYADGFDLNAFNAFIEEEGLVRGQIMERNSLDSDWWVKFDVRVEQEFPGFYKEHKASAFMVIENFGNFLDSDWGVFKQGDFVGEDIIEVGLNSDNQYVYNRFLTPAQQSPNRNASLWEIRIGVKYSF
jgi:outer membrane receptor for ferrienterochelin and colicin